MKDYVIFVSKGVDISTLEWKERIELETTVVKEKGYFIAKANND